MLIVKSGVKLLGLHPQVVLAIAGTVVPEFTERGVDTVITSAGDSTHRRHSEHYQGMAVDIRSWVFEDELDKSEVETKISRALGNEFLFRYEPTIEGQRTEHFHIEWRP